MPRLHLRWFTIADTPSELILQYRSQGYPDDSIQQALQQAGYTSQQIYDGFNQADANPGAATAATNVGMETSAPTSYNDRNDTEAIVESAVEEKWKDLESSLKPLLDWKEKADMRITKVEQEILILKENFDKLHEGVLGKISEYDTNLEDVGSSIKAMDKVMKEVLPELNESVNRLSRISKK